MRKLAGIGITGLALSLVLASCSTETEKLKKETVAAHYEIMQESEGNALIWDRVGNRAGLIRADALTWLDPRWNSSYLVCSASCEAVIASSDIDSWGEINVVDDAPELVTTQTESRPVDLGFEQASTKTRVLLEAAPATQVLLTKDFRNRSFLVTRSRGLEISHPLPFAYAEFMPFPGASSGGVVYGQLDQHQVAYKVSLEADQWRVQEIVVPSGLVNICVSEDANFMATLTEAGITRISDAQADQVVASPLPYAGSCFIVKDSVVLLQTGDDGARVSSSVAIVEGVAGEVAWRKEFAGEVTVAANPDRDELLVNDGEHSYLINREGRMQTLAGSAGVGYSRTMGLFSVSDQGKLESVTVK